MADAQPSPLSAAKKAKAQPSDDGGGERAAPSASRWRTPEFVFYLAFLGYIYWLAFGIVMDMSNEFNGPNARHLDGLKPGWFGRKIDLRDAQYAFFHENIPLLTGAATGFLALSYAVRKLSGNSFRSRLWFYATFSFGFLVFANGSSVGFMAVIVLLNFAISRLASAPGRLRALAPWATWAFNLGVLLANEKYHGYMYRQLPAWAGGRSELAVWLDSHRKGLFPWQNLFNLVVLRMISYNMDYYWFCCDTKILDRNGAVVTFSRHAGGDSAASAAAASPSGAVAAAPTTSASASLLSTDAAATGATAGSASASSSSSAAAAPGTGGASAACAHCKEHGQLYACSWWREKSHQPADSYRLLPYVVYLFYVPLHLAGPTITFNAFVSHIRHAQRSYSPQQLLAYVVRLVLIVALMEWMLSYMYCFAISENRVWKWANYTPAQVSLLGYFTLKTMWLKFLIIWRFFRAWALLDGVEAPENMNRCMSNNYSLQGFWRSWHRSFNRWLVRYIYVPLGGSRVTGARGVALQIVNTFLVFAFVAFWHDRTLQLLAWGGYISLCFIPELTLNWYFYGRRQMRAFTRRPVFRHLKACAAAVCIFAMMAANLVGYSVGIEGTQYYLTQILTLNGMWFVGLIFAVFFAAAQIMFEIRAAEERRGVSAEF